MGVLIDSMTVKERRFPDLINGSRKKRIADGSGMQIADVNRLLKQHKQMQKMVKKVSRKGGMQRMMRGMQGLPGMQTPWRAPRNSPGYAQALSPSFRALAPIGLFYIIAPPSAGRLASRARPAAILPILIR